MASTSSTTSTGSGTTAIQFSGVTSGLDTAGIIDVLMQVQQAPLNRLTVRMTDLAARQSAVNDVRSSFTDLLSKLRAFTESKKGASMAGTSSDTSAFTATATTAAIAASHAVRVDRLATATVARSTGAIGTPVTDGSQALASLPLRGSVTAGTVGMVVDGTVVKVTVGDPASMTLDQLGTAMAAAMTAQVGSDTGASFGYSIVDNKLRFTLSGGSSAHTVAFGVSGDTSNALGILGLSTAGATVSAGQSLTSTSLLGVVQATKTLGTAFTGLAGTTGTLSINGVDFAWDAATDTLTGMLSRINASNAGVVATIDRTNDRVVLTAKTAGATALDIRDTGGFAAALNLAPGTTGAQTIGANALVTVNGTQYTSQTNQVTNAIDGVTLNLVAESTKNATLAVTPDRTVITETLQALVTSYNSMLDKVASYSANDPNSTSRGVLATDQTVSALVNQVRSMIFSSTGGTPGYATLASIGLNTGTVGSKTTTGRLTLDTAKLNAALDANPSAVADLLGSASGAIKPLVDKVNTYAGIGGVFYRTTQEMANQLGLLNDQKAALQARLDAKRAALETKYTAMETTLSGLNATLGQLTAQSNAGSSGS